MLETPYKGLIRHLEKHILKYDKNQNLILLADQTHQIYKWLGNTNINKEISNYLWKKPSHHQQTKDISHQIPNWIVYRSHPQTTFFFMGNKPTPCKHAIYADIETWLT